MSPFVLLADLEAEDGIEPFCHQETRESQRKQAPAAVQNTPRRCSWPKASIPHPTVASHHIRSEDILLVRVAAVSITTRRNTFVRH